MGTTITGIDELREKTKQRTEWLTEFHNAHWETKVIFKEMDNVISACHMVGSERMAEILTDFSEALQLCIRTMDESVSRGIHEQAKDRWDQIGQTFSALLGSMAESTPPRKDGAG
jgi:hypothetical protein